MALALALLVLALWVAEVWVLFAKASRIAVTVASVALVSWVALLGYYLVSDSGKYAWAVPQYYSLAVEGSGPHTLHLNPIKGLPGFVVWPVTRGIRHEYSGWRTDPLPCPIEDIRKCGWRIIRPTTPVHFHDSSCGCVPKNYLFEIGDPWSKSASRDGVDLEYQVSNETRPILSAIELEVGFPFGYGDDLAVGKFLDRAILALTLGGGAIAIVGVFIQFRRLRKGRPN